MFSLYTSYGRHSLFEIGLNINLSVYSTYISPYTYTCSAHLICTAPAKTEKQSIKKNIKHFLKSKQLIWQIYINLNGNIESIHVSIFTVAPKHEDVQPHVRHCTFVDWLLSPTSTDDHADNDTDDEADE